MCSMAGKCDHMQAVRLGHGGKFWRNILGSPGDCCTFWARGTARCLHRIILFLKHIYTSNFACHKHCGCTSVHSLHIRCGKLCEVDYMNEMLAAYRPYPSTTLSEETLSMPTTSLPPASINIFCRAGCGRGLSSVILLEPTFKLYLPCCALHINSSC